MSSVYTSWSTDEVSNWLSSLSLHHLIPNFERQQVDGPRLATLSDQDLRSKLRLTKPAELMAIKGAIRKLVDDATRPTYLEHNTTRRINTSPRLPGTQIPRDRSGSLDKKMAKTVPRETQRYNTVTAACDIRQPQLIQGSASDLVDKDCKYSGWIRKQGGGYKSCK